MNNKISESVSIIGLGWFGLPLAIELSKQYIVKGTTRSPEKLSALKEQGLYTEVLDETSSPTAELLNAEIIVLNIPPFRKQLQWFQSWPWSEKSRIIFISSTSVYGDQEGELNEKSPAIPNTENGQILLDEESWFMHFPNWTIIRFGGLIGGERHPGKFLAGRQELENGNWPVNLIHQNDCVAFTKLIIERKITGEIFNLVHPQHPTRADYYTEYCRRNNLALPNFKTSSSQGRLMSSRKVQTIYSFQSDLF